MVDSFKPVPNDYRSSLARTAEISRLKKGAHVHLVGICGTGMAAVGLLLKQLGFRVTGSDKAFYPPMGDVVRGIAEKLFEGYAASNLDSKPDIVVIGNSMSRGNVEVEAVIERGIPYGSMPEFFSALLIGSHEHCRTSVVITGTHGKTTTSAAAAVMLDRAGLKPGYFIGGVPQDLPSGIRAVDPTIPAEKRCVVLEGDEYDSAFFAKWPKFLSYRPDILVVTSLEFDHADIYESLEQIEIEFTRLVMSLPKGGHLIVCTDNDRLRRLAFEWSQGESFAANFHTYGMRADAEYKLLSRTPLETSAQEVHYSFRGRLFEAQVKLSGEHNALNLLAVAAVGDLLGLSEQAIRQGLESFEGVLRRQQVLAERNGITVIEDFAHHPTAVAVTLQGLRESYPGRRLIAVFEPRSNTSRRGFFQQEYGKSFGAADCVVMKEVTDAGGYSGVNVKTTALDVSAIIDAVNRSGTKAKSFPEVSAIQDYLLKELRSGDVVVLMSNGDFGGLMQSLVSAL